MKKTFVGLLIFSLVLPALNVSAASIPYGGTLTIGFDQAPKIMNPLLVQTSVSMGVIDLVFSRLVRCNEKGEIEPELAESWNISPDGLVYTFYLRRGVRFHDGVELTAEDVDYTYRKIIELGDACPYSHNLNVVDAFEVIGPYTFRITLKKRSAAFSYELRRHILPKHLYAGSDLLKSSLNYKPMGSGPFKFKEWNADHIMLEANPDYFEGRPYLDRVIYKIFGSKSEVWSALMRGESDMMVFMNVEDYEVTKQDGSFNAVAYPGQAQYALIYNLNDPLMKDARVRKALSYAINRQQLIERVEGGYGAESMGPFAPSSWAYNPRIKPDAYDSAKAKAMLKEAGWGNLDRDGILEKDEKSLVLRILIDSRQPKTKKIAMVLRQQLQEVGVKTLIQLYDTDKPVFDVSGFQAYLKFHLGAMPDPNEVVKDWHSKDTREGQIFKNKNSRIDRLIELGQAATSRQSRKIIYDHFQRVVHYGYFRSFLYFPYLFHATSRKIENAGVYFNLYMPDQNIRRFYLSSQKEEGGWVNGNSQPGFGRLVRAR